MTTDLTADLAGQALVFNLLGKLLYEYPEAAWLQSLADDCVFDEIPFGAQRTEVGVGLALLQTWTQANRDGRLNLDELRADYTRLFVGPGKIIAPPWESAQVDEERLTFQEETLAVRAWYARFGLQVVRLYSEPDDHVGLELAFLAHMTQLALAAENDPARQREILAAERAFVAEHVQKWVPGWCAQVVGQARTDFYRGVARVTAGVVAELVMFLEQLPEAEAER
jgi:TorA maturation chaperone TorD